MTDIAMKIRVFAELFSETFQNIRQWSEFFLSTGKNGACQPKILYSVKISFKNKGEKTHLF